MGYCLGEYKPFCLTPYGRELAAAWADYATEKGRIFARTRGCDRDEAEAEARLALVRAIAFYDPARCELEPYLGFKLWADLRHWHRPRSDAKHFRTRRHHPLSEATDSHDGGAAAESVQVAILADELIALAPDRDQPVLCAYYRDGWTQERIAARMGIGNRWVSRRLKDGLEVIRRRLRGDFVPHGVVPHPDYPGYGADTAGTPWSLRTRVARPMTPWRNSAGKLYIRLYGDGSGRSVQYADFLATHPLHQSSRSAG